MNTPYLSPISIHHGPLHDEPDTADADAAFTEYVTNCVEGGFGFWGLEFAEQHQPDTMKAQAKVIGALIRWYRRGDEDGLHVEAKHLSEALDRYIAEKLKKETV